MERVKLKDILLIKTGKYDANHASEDGAYTFYTCAIKPLKANTYSFDDEVIILPGNGANVGEVLYFNGKLEAYQRTYVLHNIQAEVKYVFYMLKTYWKRHTLNKEVGSATNYIKLGHIQDFEIPLPPLPKQKSIAQKLDFARSLIELRKESIGKLDDLAKSVFVEMFGDPVENEMGWEVDKLENFCDFENGDRSSKYPSADDLVEDGIIFLSSREIVDFRFKPSNSSFITEKKYNQLSQGHCQTGDVLMTLRGNGRGKCCVFEGNYNIGFINAQMVILRFHTHMINTFFIELIRNERMFIKLLRIGSGSAQPQITGASLKAISLIIPPLPLQNKFAQTIQKIEAQKALYEAELVKLEENFEGLLQASFT